MMRKTGKRILSGILVFIIMGSLLFSSVLSVQALEEEAETTEQGESSEAESEETESSEIESEETESLEIESEETILPDTETGEGEKENTPSEESVESIETEKENPDGEDGTVYTLYITHTLRYTREGKGRHIQDSSRVRLTEADFEDGAYHLMRQAYDWEAVTASPGPGSQEVIRAEDFQEIKAGEKEYHAEIRYALKEGWEIRFSDSGGAGGASFYGVYQGAFDRIEFVPAGHITLTIYYKYSNTGGLAGIDAHAPDVIELPLKEDGTADLENWRVPHYETGNPDYHGHSHSNLQGFRTVLNPDPLNEFLVNPEAAKNPSKYPDALENGDFNLRKDVVTTSPEYQAAWDAARTAAVKGKSGKEYTFTYIAPVTNGGTSATTSTDTGKQYTLNASGLEEDLSMTIYYRRAMGTYTVNYWKAGANADGTDELVRSDPMSGRIGALTNAKHLEQTPDGYYPENISQKTIASDGSTVVDVYYSAGRIRVIFNTDHIYIPRQQVPVGGNIEFGGIREADLTAARPGYRFAGWQYRDKSGKLQDLTPGADSKFRLTDEFLGKAQIAGSQESDDTSIRVLNLYPRWEKDLTTVRIVFWTEDLNGQDVKVEDVYHNFDKNEERTVERDGYKKITHEEYIDTSASYTNVGSFTVSIETDTPLADKTGSPAEAIREQIADNLSIMGKMTISGNNGTEEVSLSDFYKQQGVTVLGGSGSNSLSASEDGGTQVYVFFGRKEYTLEFVYYFLPDQTGRESDTGVQICTNTDEFSNKPWPQENKAYPNVESIGAGWENAKLSNGNNKVMLSNEVPRRTLITAKYGADLRNAWPGSEEADSPYNSRYVLNNNGNLRISWATTEGIHHDIKPGGNVNVPGAYSTMSAAIVANTGDNTKVHHLVAFWKGTKNNTYRYNYCYEVPDLNAAEARNFPKVTLFDGTDHSSYAGESVDRQEFRNTLYLVPVTHQAFRKYGFSDLLTLKDLALTGKDAKLPSEVQGSLSDYYVIRIYNENCYAVSRQLVAIAARPINEQNPSARPNLTLVTTEQDHSTELAPGDGAGNGGYDTPDNPYDIYFYYNRSRFTVTYMSNGTTEIGKIELPYGASLDRSRYEIPLEYTKKAGDYAAEQNGYAAWSTEVKDAGGSTVDSKDFPVCAGRSASGTRRWEFAGWYLAPYGSRPMDWEDASRTPVILEGNLRLYAKWNEPSYTVEFDWNGGEIAGEEAKLQTQRIPANRSFVNNGQIPRPIREGYILQGWQITHRGSVNGDGSITWVPAKGAGDVLLEFHFDEPIASDLKVQAAWTPSGVAQVSYTVSYVDQESGKLVCPPKTVTGSYRAGAVVWERPAVPTVAAYRNYVPLEQNQSVTLDTVDENRIVFHYVPPSAYPYQVKFVEKGTNAEILNYDYTTKSASLLVYPGKAQVQKLDELGYQVVDANGKPEENGAKLAQAVKPGAENKPAAVFWVKPREYEIRYTNLEVMGAEEAAKLSNPASYTSKDAPITLHNPGGIYLFNGREVTFQGWRLERTRETGPAADGKLDFGDSDVAASVTIQTGSRGNLIFRAVWSYTSYVVYFYPGSHGSFPGHEPVIDFGGLPAHTLLQDQVTVPAVTPAGGDAFIGWRWEEGKDASRLYTEKEILSMTIEDRDLHFTARYRSDRRKEPDSPGSPGRKGGSGASVVSNTPARVLLPKTGMDWGPPCVLGLLGILLVFLGICQEKARGRSKGKDE